MNLAAEREAYEAAGSLAEELPYWGWLPHLPFCLTRSGELLAIARLDPAVLDGRTPKQLDRVLDRWQRLLSNLSPDTRFYFYLLRRPGDLPAVEGLSGVADISQRRRRRFLSKRVQQLETYVAWCHNPNLPQAARRGANGGRWWLDAPRAWIKRRRNPHVTSYLAAAVEQAAFTFGQVVAASSALVDDVTPVTLLEPGPASALLSELINRPGIPWSADPTRSALSWQLALSELEAERRHLLLDGEPVLLYSLLSPPVQARANLFHDLSQLDSVTTLSIEWRPYAIEKARRKIRSAQRHFFQKRYSMMAHMQDAQGTAAAMVDAAADSESARLGDALVELEADGIAYGDLSLTIALHGALDRTQRLDADVRRIIGATDAKVIREAYGQLPAWFSRLPGQPRNRQVRSVFGSAGVAASLAPLLGSPAGTPRSPHLDRPALAIFETRSRTPYHYDLFGGGGGDVGHTLILGATGSGKSFLLNFLLVQALRYDPRVLILDLGGSYRWLTQFLGGGYLELSPQTGASVALKPFSLPPGERTFNFLTAWISRLLRLGGYQLTGDDPSELRDRVADLYAFPAARRTMGAFVHSLPKTMWPALSRWHGEGAWARYFDNAGDDELRLEDWQVIDLAGAAEHEDLCQAALFYLLERLRLALDDPAQVARVKLMVVDEAWKYLADPAVLGYLAEAAKTWRKRNAALILATQSAGDLTRTTGAAALLESMPTKLFLANPDLPQDVAQTFRLNDTEMQTIRDLLPKRELYLRRARTAQILRLEVDPESYWLYTSSPVDAERRAAAVEAHGLEEGLKVLARPQ